MNEKYLFSFFLILSCVIHIALTLLSTQIWLNTGMDIEEEVRKTFRMRDITFLREVKIQKPVKELQKIQFPNIKKEIMQEAQKLFFDETPYQGQAIDSREEILHDPEMIKEENFHETIDRNFENILHVIDEAAEEDILIERRQSFISASREEASDPDMEGALNSIREGAEGRMKSEYDLVRRRETLSPDFQEDLTGISRSKSQVDDLSETAVDISVMEDRMLKGETQTADAVVSMDNMDEFIELQIRHAFFPEDNAGYFRMELKMKEMSTGLHSFAKDVIFVLDISRSMEEEQVQKVIEAIKKIIVEELESRDRFNIVLFSRKNRFFREKPVSRASVDWNAKLQEFFRGTAVKGQTDVYGSLSEIMSLWSTEKDRAGILILISDGRSTKGVQDPAEVIRKITRINRDKWRIYCFGNERADRFLLDMLSYMNRGYSLYGENFIRLDRDMMRLFDEIRRPVVLNVSFQHTGAGIESVYPLVIPDLFEKGKVVFYGKYQDEESIFTGRIVGDTLLGRKEIIFPTYFRKIPQDSGDRSLKEDFERAKIFEAKKPEL